MSDTFSAAVEAASGLGQMAFGAAGGVVLGDFVFDGFEVPEYVSTPGRQALVVHKLPGGERVIDLLGDDPGEITWAGVMLDSEPYSRAQQLEQMRIDAQPLALQFGSWFYTVFVSSLDLRPAYSRVAYSISCTVLRNEASADNSTSETTDDLVSSDVATAVTDAPAEAASALTTAQTALASVGSLIPGSAAIGQATAILGTASSALSAVSASAGGIISGLNGLASATDLTSAVAAADNLAHSTVSLAYVGRAVKNLAA